LDNIPVGQPGGQLLDGASAGDQFEGDFERGNAHVPGCLL
jgi:hypothetical protein